jgi:hypothetical protein
MPRLSLTLGCLITATALLSCGKTSTPSTPEVESLFPLDNQISGWVEFVQGKMEIKIAGIQIAYNTPDPKATPAQLSLVAVVDGDGAPFKDKFEKMAYQFYKNAGLNFTLDLRVYQTSSASACKTLFDSLLSCSSCSLYTANTWQAASVGDASRSCLTGTAIWVNACKGAYYIEAKVEDASLEGIPDTEANRAIPISFIAAVVKNIP